MKKKQDAWAFVEQLAKLKEEDRERLYYMIQGVTIFSEKKERKAE